MLAEVCDGCVEQQLKHAATKKTGVSCRNRKRKSRREPLTFDRKRKGRSRLSLSKTHTQKHHTHTHTHTTTKKKKKENCISTFEKKAHTHTQKKKKHTHIYIYIREIRLAKLEGDASAWTTSMTVFFASLPLIPPLAAFCITSRTAAQKIVRAADRQKKSGKITNWINCCLLRKRNKKETTSTFNRFNTIRVVVFLPNIE